VSFQFRGANQRFSGRKYRGLKSRLQRSPAGHRTKLLINSRIRESSCTIPISEAFASEDALMKPI
jgi:hypothetical protein